MMFSQNYSLSDAVACVKSNVVDSSVPRIPLCAEDAPVVRDLGNGLCVVYLINADDNLIYVQNHDLLASGLTEDGLFDIGKSNLIKISDGKAIVKQFGQIYGMFLDNLFEASLILRDDLWDETLCHLAPNGFVAALPARDVLAVCDARSSEGIASLKAMVSRAFSEGKSHLVTPDLYQRENGAWVRLA